MPEFYSMSSLSYEIWLLHIICMYSCNGEYEIVFDTALIIKTESQTIMFSRDVWFSEVINISDNDDYDCVYPIDSVIEHWSNEGDYEVTVKRSKKSI